MTVDCVKSEILALSGATIHGTIDNATKLLYQNQILYNRSLIRNRRHPFI